MKIHRARHSKNFTVLPNATIRDERLSALARCVLHELLSHTDGYHNATALKMWERARAARGTRAESRRAYFDAFAELRTHGYMIRELVRRGSAWVTLVHVYDTPQLGVTTPGQPEPGHPQGGKSKRSTNEQRTTGEERASVREHATTARAYEGAHAPPGPPSANPPPKPPRPAPANASEASLALLAHISDTDLRTPAKDRAALAGALDRLAAAGLDPAQLWALVRGTHTLSAVFPALMSRLRTPRQARAFLEGRLGHAGPATTAPPPPKASTARGDRCATGGDLFAQRPAFDVDAAGTAPRTCPDHPGVRNVPGGRCRICQGPCRPEPGEIIHDPAPCPSALPPPQSRPAEPDPEPDPSLQEAVLERMRASLARTAPPGPEGHTLGRAPTPAARAAAQAARAHLQHLQHQRQAADTPPRARTTHTTHQAA